MAAKVFLSYKHGDPSTTIARHLYDHLDAVADALELEIYMDDKENRAGDVWNDTVVNALQSATHFIALLDNAYWLSPECRRELRFVLNRFEAGDRPPRLLFVKAQEIRPDLFRIDRDRQSGVMVTRNSRLKRVSDFHFLGPFDRNLRLVRLEWEHPARLDDQIAQLLDRFEATL